MAHLTTLHPSIDLVGTLVAIPERTATVAAQTEGLIRTVSVVEGAIVKSGQTLVLLDTRLAETEQLRAQAVVAQQQAVLSRLKHGYVPQEIEIAKQDAQRAKAELESLRLRADAASKLHEDNEISDVEFKKLKSMLGRDEAAYAAAAAKLDLYLVGTRPETLAEAQAQLDVANAELVRAQLAVEFCTISSPIEGVVTQLLARQGMHVAQSDQLAIVVDLSQVFAQIRVPSGYLSSVKQDARVEVSIASVREERFEGSITRFSGEADPNTGDVQAFAILQNEGGVLRPGLACRVRVWLPPIEQAIVVPISAVADREGTSVLHVVRDDKAYELEVSIGADTREYVQIMEGVSPGDLVITEGGYGLPEGCRVRTSPR
ncbi:MAG: efflux RND transporter periplasmic adaptor subunit [Planctomycetes bacterium]|nr:efflux RND transporter periplasmic adaptor subunit [Planctomycetota bacterium]